MSTSWVSPVSRPETAGIPYITADEFTTAPTGLQLGNLFPGGSQPEQVQALQEQILRASSWMDVQCHQVLAATTDTELQTVRVDLSGSARVWTRCFPVREVTAVSIGPTFNSMTALDSTTPIAVQSRSFTVQQATPFGWFGPAVQFAPPMPNAAWSQWCQYSYVNGYPVTTLSAACTSGASSIDVTSALGVLPGMTLTLSDIPNTETVIVSSVSGTTVTLSGTTSSAHVAGVAVSAMPAALKQAAILATMGFIQERGTGALVMASIGGAPTHQPKQTGTGPDALQQAMAILQTGGFIAQVSVGSQA